MTAKAWLLFAIVLAFAVARFLVPAVPIDLAVTGVFKDFAHLFVGGLFGAWLATWERKYLLLAVGLTVVEVVAFVLLNL